MVWTGAGFGDQVHDIARWSVAFAANDAPAAHGVSDARCGAAAHWPEFDSADTDAGGDLACGWGRGGVAQLGEQLIAELVDARVASLRCHRPVSPEMWLLAGAGHPGGGEAASLVGDGLEALKRGLV